MAQPTVRPPTADRWWPALWVGLAVGVAGWLGTLDTAPATAPPVVQVGTLVSRAAMDAAGVTCVGLALLTVLLPRAAAVPGDALRTLRRVRGGLDRALVAVAGGWIAAVLLGTAFRAAEAFGQPVGALGGGELLAWSTRLAAGRGMVLTAGCAAAVLVCAVLRLRDPDRIQGRLPLVIALFGMLTPAVTGHAGSSADHQLAVVMVALHAGAAGLWVGGLGALLVLLSRHRVLLDAVLPRFSRLAGVCLAMVALTGVANTALRLGSLAALVDTPSGWLVLAKTGCLAALAGLGGLTRRRLRTGRVPVLRWAGIEVTLMALTLGLAAALTQTG